MNMVGDNASARIDAGLSYLETANGERIRFTRSERAALRLFTAYPQRIVTREEILDAVSEPGSDKSDRNIDFLVNRLRKKLGDDARNPRYIATRYGEGYVWIGAAPIAEQDVAGSDLVVSEVTGLDVLGDEAHAGETFVSDLVRAFLAALGDDKRVAYAPNCPPAEEFGAAAPQHSAGVAFFSDRGVVSCVVSVRDFRSGQPLCAHRLSMAEIRSGRSAAETVARRLSDEIWRVTVTRQRQSVPMPVALLSATEGEYIPHQDMSDASNRRLLSVFETSQTRNLRTWIGNERRLRSMLAENPQDSELKLLLAAAIHSKYVMAGELLHMQGLDDRQKDEDEIETLITDALPYIRSNPDHAIMAGKLLHFLRRGYDELGRDLCEDAYAKSVSVAASLAVIGQMRAFFGETDIALEPIEQALNLSRPGSHAHAYTLVIKGQALAASGRWDDLRPVRKELSGTSAIAGLVLAPLLDHPERHSLAARSMVFLLSRRRAEATLENLHYVGARLFRDPSQGANMMLSFIRHASRRFGPDIVPQHLVRALPDLRPRLS